MHILCSDIARNTPCHVEIIAKNEEKYVSLIKYADTFSGYSKNLIDIYRILCLSFQTLTSYITDYSILEENLPQLKSLTLF